ncbi:unnamed protein product, partial [Dovyalis caffra]
MKEWDMKSKRNKGSASNSSVYKVLLIFRVIVLLGNFINFGVVEYYGDTTFKDVLDAIPKTILPISLDDIWAFRKAFPSAPHTRSLGSPPYWLAITPYCVIPPLYSSSLAFPYAPHTLPLGSPPYCLAITPHCAMPPLYSLSRGCF